jgi:hypothetical protein
MFIGVNPWDDAAAAAADDAGTDMEVARGAYERTTIPHDW